MVSLMGTLSLMYHFIYPYYGKEKGKQGQAGELDPL